MQGNEPLTKVGSYHRQVSEAGTRQSLGGQGYSRALENNVRLASEAFALQGGCHKPRDGEDMDKIDGLQHCLIAIFQWC